MNHVYIIGLRVMTPVGVGTVVESGSDKAVKQYGVRVLLDEGERHERFPIYQLQDHKEPA